MSVGSVSNVLNRTKRVNPDIVRRVHEAIEELGYVRNDAARQLRVGSSRTIGLLVYDLSNPSEAEMATAAAQRAFEKGYNVIVGSSDGRKSDEERYLRLFEEQRVAGIVLSPLTPPTLEIDRLLEKDIRVVLVDSRSKSTSISSVSVDNVVGGRLAVKHLIERGSRRIAFVGGPKRLIQVSDRLAGAISAIGDPDEIHFEQIEADAMTVQTGLNIAGELVRRPRKALPDGIFAANDLLAIGLMHGILRTGLLNIPGDIAIVGYDDIQFAETAVIPLSSIRQPTTELGRSAIDLLLEEQPAENRVLTPRLIARRSTSPAKSARADRQVENVR